MNKCKSNNGKIIKRNGNNPELVQEMNDTKSLRDDVKSLLGGSGTGLGDAEMKKVPLKEQLELADDIGKESEVEGGS